MSKIPEILANLEETLINAGIQYCASYVPSTKAYMLTIFCEDECRCVDCAHWDGDPSSECKKCYNGDMWSAMDDNG